MLPLQLKPSVNDIPSGGHLQGGGHWTRDLGFSPDGKKMFVSVGSQTNDYENPRAAESRRADILQFDPEEGRTGLRFRNCNAGRRRAWHSFGLRNERDGLGDNVPPDYITRVDQGQFYGWPWFYIGDNQDPKHREGSTRSFGARSRFPRFCYRPIRPLSALPFMTEGAFPKSLLGRPFAAYMVLGTGREENRLDSYQSASEGRQAHGRV